LWNWLWVILALLLALFSVFFLGETLPTSFCSPKNARGVGIFCANGFLFFGFALIELRDDGRWHLIVRQFGDKVNNFFLIQIFARHFNSTDQIYIYIFGIFGGR